jgi:hypothetical protein
MNLRNQDWVNHNGAITIHLALSCIILQMQRLNKLKGGNKTNTRFFLTELCELGLSYSSLNTARGALSALGISVDKYPIGQHPLIILFMKGVLNIRPSRPSYQSTWDMYTIYTHLAAFVNAIKNVNFKVKSFSDKYFTGDNLRKYNKT